MQTSGVTTYCYKSHTSSSTSCYHIRIPKGIILIPLYYRSCTTRECYDTSQMILVKKVSLCCYPWTRYQETITIIDDSCEWIQTELNTIGKYSIVTEREFSEIVIREISLIGIIGKKRVCTKSIDEYLIQYQTTGTTLYLLLFENSILIGIGIENSLRRTHIPWWIYLLTPSSQYIIRIGSYKRIISWSPHFYKSILVIITI